MPRYASSTVLFVAIVACDAQCAAGNWAERRRRPFSRLALGLHRVENGGPVQRATELVGKAIVSADNGERLGTVADILLDEKENRIVGLIVRSGWLAKERVLPFSAVQTLGRDAVVARSAGDLIGQKEWRASKDEDR
jgi:sporulation protein YlmC with PRC-barrel domain